MSIISNVYAIGELVGSFLVIPLEKRWSARVFAVLMLIICSGALILMIPFKFIVNMYAKYIITMIPVFLCAVMTSMFYPVLIAMSSRLDSTLSSALQIGNGICEVIF